MIIEQRIYELKPGTVAEFLKVYEAEGLALQTEALGRLLGYFVSEVGELNRVVQLWGYESFEDRARRRAALSADARWRAFLGKAGSAVEHQRSELLTPASFSPIR
ncbi:NIPSNAP family protein [Variovorax paradoxus]|nr:NIPSNAP family protein [Variovorax paradoxus]MBT2304057.1 NIPSNAP family protein [Variovorax paradoxus]